MDQIAKHFMLRWLEKNILIMTTIFECLLFARYYHTNNFTFIIPFKLHNSPMN